MEIQRCLIYVIINCVLITNLEAKTVSLNELLAAEAKEKREKQNRTKSTGSEDKPSLKELIAAESKQTQEKAQRPKSTGSRGKTVSLNELIAAESKQNHKKAHRPVSRAPSLRRQSFSLKDLFAAEAKHTKRKIDSLLSRNSGLDLLSHRKRLFPSIDLKHFESVESFISRARTLSPLGYRKKFEIKSPLKPKKLKHLFNPRLRRNKSNKREIFENEQISNKYVPLIKRLGLLVDDIFASGSGESYEATTRRTKRKPIQNRRESKCKCDINTDSQPAENKPRKKTVVSATTVSPEVTTDALAAAPEAPAAPADNTPPANVYTVRPDPQLSLLFTRNSTSPRRDYYGFSERSGTALHRDAERNITRNNGDDQHNPRGGRHQTCLQDDEENACGSARNDANGDGSVVGEHGRKSDPGHRYDRYETKESNEVSSDVDGIFRRDDNKTEEENKFQRQSKETIPLPGGLRRLRGFVPEHEDDTKAQPVQPQETSEESVVSVAHYLTSSERIAQRYDAPPAEDQTLRPAVETVKPYDLLNSNLLQRNSQPNQVVTIFDGYSVARDINGRNKLSEKSIHITS